MKAVHNFCARHSYSNFIKSLGGKATNTKAIIERGYGYRSWVTNFQKLLGHMGVTQSEANAYFRDIILKRGRPKRDFGRSLCFIIDKDVHITFYRSRKSPGRDGLLMPLTFVLHVCVFFFGGGGAMPFPKTDSCQTHSRVRRGHAPHIF